MATSNQASALRRGAAQINRLISIGLSLALLTYLMTLSIQSEIPTGGLAGAVLMAENSAPLAGAEVIVRPQFSLPDWHEESRRAETDDQGRFTFRMLPVGTYTVEAYGKAHSMDATRVDIADGETLQLQLALKPQDPRIELYVSQHVYAPGEEPSIQVDGFGQDPVVNLTAYAIEFEGLVRRGGLESFISQEFKWDENWTVRSLQKTAPELSVAAAIEHEVTTRDIEGQFVETVKLPALPEGLYFLSGTYHGKEVGSWLAVSQIALVAKTWGDQVLAYATDIDSGAPVPNAQVGVAGPEGSIPVGVTDSSGLLRFTLPAERSSDQVVMHATAGSSRALISFYGGGYSEETTGTRLFVYTERPVYRPGHLINYKGIARELVGSDYRLLPAGEIVDIEVRDPADSLLHTDMLTISASGTFYGSFSLNEEAPTGSYSLICRAGGAEQIHYVDVAAYRKPEYTVVVKPAKPFFIQGDKAEAIVESEYYFGGAVVGATVEAYIYRTPLWADAFTQAEMEEYGWSEEDYGYGGGEFVEQVTAETDGRGRAVIRFSTDIAPQNEFEYAWVDTDYLYRVEANVSDPAGKFYTGQGNVKVVNGSFSLRAETDRYITAPKEAIEVTLRTATHLDGGPVANAVIKVQAGYERWEDDESKFTASTTETVRTGSDGTAKLTLTPPREGYFVIKASAQDEGGRTIETTAWAYVSGGPGADFGRSMGDVTLQLDKPNYKVGDVAKLLIASKAEGASVLLTVEADTIYHAQVVTLDGSSTTIDLPIVADYLPNAFVAVAFVHDKKFFEGNRRLALDLSVRGLIIDIASDKPIYAPGDTARYTITTRDDSGNPVAAELSFAVVDESIYAIREDSTDPLGAFYPRRWNSISTLYSFPELYLGGGDKGESQIDIRTKFLDTATWVPSLQTGASGQAHVTVVLPDNLTQWRATAVGATSDTRVGINTQKVRVRKELMVRLEAPRFFTQTDHATVAAVLHNETDAPIEVEVVVKADGLDIAQGKPTQRLKLPAGTPTRVAWGVTVPGVGDAEVTVTAKQINGSLNDGVQQTFPILPHGRLMVDHHAARVTGEPGQWDFTLHKGAIRDASSLEITLSPSLASSLIDSLDYLIGYPYGCTEQTMSRFLPTVIVADTLRTLNLSRPEIETQIPDMVAKGYARLQKMQHGDGGWGWWEYDESDAWMTAYVLEGMARAESAGFPPPENARYRGIEWAKSYLTSSMTEDEGRRGPNKIFLLRALALSGEHDFVAQQIGVASLADLTRPGQRVAAVLIFNALGADYASRRDEALRLLVDSAITANGLAHWDEEWWGVETTAQAILAIATVDPAHPILPSAIQWLELQRRGDGWYSTRDTAIALAGISQYLKTTGELNPDYTVQVTLNGTQIHEAILTPASIGAPELSVELPIADLKEGQNTLEITRLLGPSFATVRLTADAAPVYYAAELRQVVDQGTLGELLRGEDLRIQRAYHKLEVKKQRDGTQRILPSEKAVTRYDAGDILQCTLTIHSSEAREFVMIEDPLPSGFEVTERAEPEDPWSWDRWWSRTDIRDDRIVFFARMLPNGDQTITYTLRAESPGNSHALPATVSLMYQPDIFASSAETAMEVKE